MRRILIASAAIAVATMSGAQTAVAQSSAAQSAGTKASEGKATATEINTRLEALFGSQASFQEFLDLLKKAVSENDKVRVAKLVHFPIRVHVGGKAWKIDNAAHFITEYDTIITSRVKQTLAGDTLEKLFANQRGVSVGDGDLWFSPTGPGRTPKITGING